MIIRGGKKGERGMEVGEEGKTGEAQSFILHRPLRRWRVERVHPYPPSLHGGKCWFTPPPECTRRKVLVHPYPPILHGEKCWSTPTPRVYMAKSVGPPLPEFTQQKVLVHPYPPSLHGEKCWSAPTPPPPPPEFTWRAVLAHP